MIALTLQQLHEALGGELTLPDGVDATTTVGGSVETDSRRVGPGSIFFALPGETTDGHRFVGTAVEAGAGLVVAERPVDAQVPVVVVDDGVAALARLATAVVARVRETGDLTVVAVTGSNGKTTTKNLLAAILSAEAPTVFPRESFNNHVGAPITMLGIDEGTRYLVSEMGASHVGEIARLVRIAQPDVGVVLKVGLAHAGEFGGVDAVARAKAEMVTDLAPDATAVLNADDPRVAAMRAQTPAQVVTFGLAPDADLRADDVEATATGTAFTLVDGATRLPVRLRILGEHHVMNALAALSVAKRLGIPLERAVAAIEAVPRAERWRMEVLTPREGVTVINDAYNASPDSMAAALKTLAQIAPEGHAVAVLGEMAELGEFADEEHDRIGRLVVRLGIERLIVVGERARRIQVAAGLEGSWNGESAFAADAESAQAMVEAHLTAGDVVLVKSSKSAGLRFLGDRLGGVAS